eukprot:COSAG05_NODE_986_length_6286_cov_3.404881_5_plen_299_part_00
MWFRAAMFPYIYTTNWRTTLDGISLMRRTYFEAAEHPEAYQYEGQYFFGPSLLVAPIVEPINPHTQTIPQRVWLPPGLWSTWDGQRVYESGPNGQLLTANYSISEIPVFVRGGAVVAMRDAQTLQDKPALLSTLVASSDPLVWTIFPGLPAGESGHGSVYEDDGETIAYQSQRFALTSMAYTSVGPVMTVTIMPTEGNFGVNCSMQEGVELAGDTLLELGERETAEACCSACSSYSNCPFWTWVAASKQCIFKSSQRGLRTNVSCTSGVARRPMLRVRANIIGHARKKYVGETQSCMV